MAFFGNYYLFLNFLTLILHFRTNNCKPNAHSDNVSLWADAQVFIVINTEISFKPSFPEVILEFIYTYR